MSFLKQIACAEKSKKKAIFKHWIDTKPLQLFAELRQQQPIFFLLGKQGPVIVTRFRDVQEVLSRPTVFTVQSYQPKMDPVVGDYMLAQDDTPLNERDKAIMRAMLCRDDLPRVRQQCGNLADEAIDTGLRHGSLEVVSQLSRKVIAQMVEQYFGFPGSDPEALLRWSRATQHDMFHNFENDPKIHAASCQAGTEMRKYLKNQLIPQRREELKENPHRNDVLSRLLMLSRLLKTVLPNKSGFNEERIIANTMGLLVGAVETSSAAIVQALDMLLSRPEQLQGAQQAAQADDDKQLSQYVWEALRFSPQAPFLARVCVNDYTIAAGSQRATKIPAGRVVFASTASAMHDDWELEQPDVFRLDRPAFHTMHLGYGHHRCLGDHLSLIQVPEILKRLLRRPGLRRACGSRGSIDRKGGPFPENFYINLNPARPAAPAVFKAPCTVNIKGEDSNHGTAC
jgi:cytochrome P450